MMSFMRTLQRCRRGASLVEYGLLAGLVAVVAISSASSLGAKNSTTFCSITRAVNASVGDGNALPCYEVLGSAGSDTLVGTERAEIIDPGPDGNDNLTGGGGADVFRFSYERLNDGVAQITTIEDYQPGIDSIDLSGMTPSSIMPQASSIWLFVGPQNDFIAIDGVTDVNDLTFR